MLKAKWLFITPFVRGLLSAICTFLARRLHFLCGVLTPVMQSLIGCCRLLWRPIA